MNSERVPDPRPASAASSRRREGGARQSSPDVVVAAVKQGILSGRYLPGQRLLEADLCREFDLSRGPVREAMTRLAGEGVVESGPGRGTYVRALTRTEVLDVLQVLEVLIGLAARLAIQRCKYGDNRRKLLEALERLESQIAAGDTVLLSIERTRFYDTLFEIAGNPELTRAHPRVPAQILRAQVYRHVTHDEKASQYADYRPLVDAIVGGDARGVARIVESHLRRSRTHALHMPEEAFQVP